MFYYSQELDTDKVKTRQARKVVPSCYRVYIVNDTIHKADARGFWLDNGKLYKDKIIFNKFTNYQDARSFADDILANSQEICVSIENINKNILYILYRDKTLSLKVKHIKKTQNKRQAISYIKELTRANGGATVEHIRGYYIITSYK